MKRLLVYMGAVALSAAGCGKMDSTLGPKYTGFTAQALSSPVVDTPYTVDYRNNGNGAALNGNPFSLNTASPKQLFVKVVRGSNSAETAVAPLVFGAPIHKIVAYGSGSVTLRIGAENILVVFRQPSSKAGARIEVAGKYLLLPLSGDRYFYPNQAAIPISTRYLGP